MLSRTSWDITWEAMQGAMDSVSSHDVAAQTKPLDAARRKSAAISTHSRLLLDTGVTREGSALLTTAAACAYLPGVRCAGCRRGFSLAACSRNVLASQLGKRVLVVDKRNHIAGNAYDHLDEHGILVHRYGPHIFHTNAAHVVEYLSRFY